MTAPVTVTVSTSTWMCLRTCKNLWQWLALHTCKYLWPWLALHIYEYLWRWQVPECICIPITVTVSTSTWMCLHTCKYLWLWLYLQILVKLLHCISMTVIVSTSTCGRVCIYGLPVKSTSEITALADMANDGHGWMHVIKLLPNMNSMNSDFTNRMSACNF